MHVVDTQGCMVILMWWKFVGHVPLEDVPVIGSWLEIAPVGERPSKSTFKFHYARHTHKRPISISQIIKTILPSPP
jgi:hypothetical protein